MLFCCIYLRPWTLARKITTRAVPHLANLADVDVTPRQGSSQDTAAPALPSMRRAWKAYTQHMLPHASRQISNFMLACLAEGRTHDRDDEGAFRRGDSMTCELTGAEITEIMNASKKQDMQSADPESTTGADTRSARAQGAGGHAKRIAATTALALRLAEASKCFEEFASVRANNLLKSQRIGAPVRKDEKAEDLEELRQCVVAMHEHDWQAAYAQWKDDVNNKILQKGIPVPIYDHSHCFVFHIPPPPPPSPPPLLPPAPSRVQKKEAVAVVI